MYLLTPIEQTGQAQRKNVPLIGPEMHPQITIRIKYQL